MGNPTYKCPISINVDYNILRKYAFYYVYIRENKKEAKNVNTTIYTVS